MLERRKINDLRKIFVFAAWAVMLIGLTGCSGYGRVTRDPDVTKAIQNNQIIEGYRYYYYGYANEPWALAGIDPKYKVTSKLWREVDPKSENDKFKRLIYWIWVDYSWHPYGAYILDPSGAKAGIWYSSINGVAVRFKEDNTIVLMPNKPFLRGPSAELEESLAGLRQGNVDTLNRIGKSAPRYTTKHLYTSAFSRGGPKTPSNPQ
jgi:hypothetical protein